MKNTQKIAVIGGGLAGLTAAYELLKNGVPQVDLVESQPFLGGRVQSRKIRGQNIDFGGFIIYPWYTQSHRLFKELKLEQKLTKTPLSDIFYYLNNQSAGLLENEIPFSNRETVELWGKSIFKILQKTELSRPDLDRFDRQTISEYLRKTVGTENTASLYETFFDTVNQGYCYGPVNKIKAAFMAPITREITFHGDIRSSSFFKQGTGLLTKKLEQEIRKLGGNIHLNSPVQHVDGKTIKSNQMELKTDAIIFAQTVSQDLYQQMIPKIEIGCWYTHFVTVAVELADIPLIHGKQNWGATFYESHVGKQSQTLSVINLTALYGNKLHGCFMFNIILHDQSGESLEIEAVQKIIDDEVPRLFPQSGMGKILDHVHWGKTMPVAQETFVEAIRTQHGKDGYYFAGDFLGAPSIETAIATGAQAAQDVLQSPLEHSLRERVTQKLQSFPMVRKNR